MNRNIVTVNCSRCSEESFEYEYEDFVCNNCGNIMECVFEVSPEEKDDLSQSEICLSYLLDLSSTCETIEEWETIVNTMESIEENKYVSIGKGEIK